MTGSRKMLLALGFALVASPAAAVFHNRLTKSLPKADAVLSEGPTTVRLWFSQKPAPRFSRVTLTDAEQRRIKTSKMRATDDSMSVAADVEGPIAPGTYQVAWRTAGDDGHAVRGKYSFTVQP